MKEFDGVFFVLVVVGDVVEDCYIVAVFLFWVEVFEWKVGVESEEGFDEGAVVVEVEVFADDAVVVAVFEDLVEGVFDGVEVLAEYDVFAVVFFDPDGVFFEVGGDEHEVEFFEEVFPVLEGALVFTGVEVAEVD